MKAVPLVLRHEHVHSPGITWEGVITVVATSISYMHASLEIY